MTGNLEVGGGFVLSVKAPEAAPDADLIDRLIELVLALEPFEIKQRDADDPLDVPMAGDLPAPTPTLLAESTGRMLAQMRAVLDREAARLGVDGAEGKAAVDQVALIARTLEKIDQMERLIAGDQARSERQALSTEEREQLRQTVRQLILAAAERLAAERRADAAAEGEDAAPDDDGPAEGGDEKGL